MFFLIQHVVDTSWVAYWPAGYGHAIELYRSPLFMIGEIFLVAAIIYHGLNGLKVIYLDLRPHLWNHQLEQKATTAVYIASVVLWLPAAILMGRHLFSTAQPEKVTDPKEIAAFINIAILVLLGIGAAMVLGVGGTAAKRKAVVPRTFETWMYWFMRYSGVLLIPLVYGHVIIKDIIHGVHAIDLNYVALYWGTLGWRVYDAALLAFTLAHGMNGLKQVAEDYIHQPARISLVRKIILALWLLVTISGAYALIVGVKVAG